MLPVRVTFATFKMISTQTALALADVTPSARSAPEKGERPDSKPACATPTRVTKSQYGLQSHLRKPPAFVLG